jgi:hypothetical protein
VDALEQRDGLREDRPLDQYPLFVRIIIRRLQTGLECPFRLRHRPRARIIPVGRDEHTAVTVSVDTIAVRILEVRVRTVLLLTIGAIRSGIARRRDIAPRRISSTPIYFRDVIAGIPHELAGSIGIDFSAPQFPIRATDHREHGHEGKKLPHWSILARYFPNANLTRV